MLSYKEVEIVDSLAGSYAPLFLPQQTLVEKTGGNTYLTLAGQGDSNVYM